jgi:ribonuclease P protein component
MILRAVKVLGNSTENLPATRFGISISQKVSKKSVVRNLIKRRLKAGIRQLLTEILPGWLVVIIVKPTAVECFYDEILRELKELLLTAEVRKSYGNSGRSDL